jgi:hypothetical protein
MHAYSMKDCARERYVLYLALIAAAAAAIAQQIAGYLGVAVSLGTVAIFTALFLAFDNWAWKHRLFGRVVAIPDLNGTWKLTGNSIADGGEKREWNAIARIKQSWSRIAISIETDLSRSRSGLAAIERDPGHGFRLIYGYLNEPKSPDDELGIHRGTCEVIFSESLDTGQGTYFNDHQRRTVGTMEWTRIPNEDKKS